MAKQLTRKQREFIQGYLETDNGTKAAMAAYSGPCWAAIPIEVGHRFRADVGHLFRPEVGHFSGDSGMSGQDGSGMKGQNPGIRLRVS